MTETTFVDDVQALENSLANLPEPTVRPVFIVVSGLPGTGKSSFSRQLAQRVPVAILETDGLRKALFVSPTHSANESARLFKAAHRLIHGLLRRGVSVLLDATNLVEGHRERLYNIADQLGVKLILIRIEAPTHVVKERLEGRTQMSSEEDRSSADWAVYQRMRPSMEPIRRNHFAVDTSRDVGPTIEKVVRELHRWMRAKA